MRKTKYIFVTGGVLSGVGKGITAASMGAILQSKGLKVTVQKCDVYLNVDAGHLDPMEHGEIFVTADGLETDLDLGHYERFLDIETNKYSTTLSGSLFKELIDKERAGKFGGKTVQLMPHFVQLVQEKILTASEGSDVHIVEIGGTIGDYESLSFVEAIRTFPARVGRQNCLYTSVVYVPWINTSKELKTKPAQNALKDLRGFGIIPDVVCARTEKQAGRDICEKIALFAGIPAEAVVNLPDAASVYDVPLNVLKSGVVNILNDFVGNEREPDMSKWESLSRKRAKTYAKTVRVGLVAGSVGNDDAYLSVTEALRAAAFESLVNLDLRWIDATKVTESDIADVDGVIMPGMFGNRGVEGKIDVAKYALEHDVPFLGVGTGMQIAVIAAARRAGLIKANSEKFDCETPANVIKALEAETRLGDRPAVLDANSRAARVYGTTDVVERYRHRYAVNKKFLAEVEDGGVVVSGTSPDGKIAEFMEAPGCKFFIGTQAHPEFRSRPMRAHPLFVGFVKVLKSIEK